MATHLLKKRAATTTPRRGRSTEQEYIYQRAVQVHKTLGKTKDTYFQHRDKLALVRVQVSTHPMHNAVTKFLQDQGEEGQEFLQLLIKREQELVAYKLYVKYQDTLKK